MVEQNNSPATPAIPQPTPSQPPSAHPGHDAAAWKAQADSWHPSQDEWQCEREDSWNQSPLDGWSQPQSDAWQQSPQTTGRLPRQPGS